MNELHRNSSSNILISLVIFFLASEGSLVGAADTDFGKWKCKLCPTQEGWYGELYFGPGYASDDNLRFGDYRGLENQGVYPGLGGDVHYRDPEGNFVDLYARNLGLDSRQLDIRGGRQGKYELRFAWREIPKYRGYDTQTPFSGVGDNSLSLPANWQPAFDTTGMTTLAESLVNTPLKTLRKTLDAGLTVELASAWSYEVDFQRQKKNGTRAFGAGIFLNNASHIPAPVDFTTDQINAGLTWASKRSSVRFGFLGSWFDNGNNSVTWQNPFSSGPNNETLQAALEPDNRYYQFNLTGVTNLLPGTRISGQAALGRSQQNDIFSAYSTSPAFSDLPLPRLSLGASLDTSNVNLAGKISTRLNRKLTLNARIKLDERDNKTPVDLYTPVTTDLILGGERYNRPYSYNRRKYSADLRFRAHRAVRLRAGVKRVSLDRTLQAVERSNESTWWGEARLNPLATVQFRLKVESARRDTSEYSQPEDGGPVDHPLLRKFNQADRDRDRVLVEFDLTPLDALGISFSYFNANDGYRESLIGLQNSEEDSATIDLNYAFNSKASVYAFLTRDKINAQIVGASSSTATPWNANTSDRITTAGIGLSAKVGKKSSISFDYISSVSRGDVAVQTTQEEAPFAPLRTNLRNARLNFDHQFNKRWGIKVYAEYEKYRSQDWAIDNLGTDGIGSILTFGAQSPNYSAWSYRLLAGYRF